MTSTAGSDSPTAYPFWHRLEPGAYACGFKSFWQLDYGRAYNTAYNDNSCYAEGKSPRPLLINLWYPAEVEPRRTTMAYGDYFQIQSDHPRLARFSAELAAYAKAVLVNELFRKEEAKLTPAEAEGFRALMETRTAACKDAAVAEGKFPFVIYMGGSDSSFEDSSILCEFLASHGYVVIGSAFQKVDGTSLSLQGTVRAAGDIRFLVSYARDLPFADWSHIGMIGHSLGAQAAIIYQTEPGCAVDATVSLDTTQDYHSLAEPNWQNMTGPVKEAIATMTRPILFAANANAGFEMADSMTAAPRYLLTVDSLFHDDFVTLGSLERWIKLRLPPCERAKLPWAELVSFAEQERADAEEANRVWERYGALCKTILHFLEATLCGRPAALNAQVDQSATQGFRGDEPYIEHVLPGTNGATPYVSSVSLPPSPRQIRQIVRTRGAEAAVAALREGWQAEPWIATSMRRWRYPAYDGLFAFSLLYQLMAEGKTDEAKVLYRGYDELGRKSGWPPAYPGFYFIMAAQMDKSRTCLEYLLALEPGHEQAARELTLMHASDRV